METRKPETSEWSVAHTGSRIAGATSPLSTLQSVKPTTMAMHWLIHTAKTKNRKADGSLRRPIEKYRTPLQQKEETTVAGISTSSLLTT